LTIVDEEDDDTRGGDRPASSSRWENGFKIYHMGDTGLFGDMKLIADYYKPISC